MFRCIKQNAECVLIRFILMQRSHSFSDLKTARRTESIEKRTTEFSRFDSYLTNVYLCLKNIETEYFSSSNETNQHFSRRDIHRVIRRRARDLSCKKVEIKSLLDRVAYEQTAYDIAKLGIDLKREKERREHERSLQTYNRSRRNEEHFSWCQMQ